MTTELPENPESREESYLASIAGQDVVLPDEPLSRKEQYLAYIAENGGGGGSSYTAGTGIDITGNTISVDEEVIPTLTELNKRVVRGTGVPTTATEGVVGGLYEDNTNGKLYICTAVTAGVDSDPDTYTWEEVGGGGVTPVYTLTSADFNWNSTTNTATEPYNCVALWLLPPGVYNVGSLTANTQWKVNNSMVGNESSYNMFVVTAPSFQNIVFIYGYFNGNASSVLPISLWRVVNTTGNIFSDDPILYLTNGSVVQTTGTSTASVMSQNATTSMVYNDPSTKKGIVIGSGASIASAANAQIAIGQNATAGKSSGSNILALGRNSVVDASTRGIAIGGSEVKHDYSIGIGGSVPNNAGDYNVAIGYGAMTGGHWETSSVALGYDARTSRSGEVYIGTENSRGYNSTNYRVLGGVHDPVDAHDAATKGYCDTHFGEYNIYSIANAAFDNPNNPQTILSSAYEELRAAAESGARIVYLYNSGGFFKGYCESIDMPDSNGVSITFGSNSLNGVFNFSLDGAVATVTFSSN